MNKKRFPIIRVYFKKNNQIKIAKDGRSYKLYIKSKFIWKCRFNKTNINIFYIKNTCFIKTRRYKNYMLFPFWKKKNELGFNQSLNMVRPFNTFTNRGILIKNRFFHKRQGRISGYI